MNKYSMFPLLIMVVISAIWLLLGHSIEQLVFSDFESFWEFGTSPTFEVDLGATLDWNNVIIPIALGIAALSASILGSGISSEGLEALKVAIVYTCLWSALSYFAFELFEAIPIFGLVLYVVLTMFYAGGVVLEMTDTGGDS